MMSDIYHYLLREDQEIAILILANREGLYHISLFQNQCIGMRVVRILEKVTHPGSLHLPVLILLFRHQKFLPVEIHHVIETLFENLGI